MKKGRTRHSAGFKAKVALEAVREQQSVAELGVKFQLHPNQISKWKRQLLDNMERIFVSGAVAKDEDGVRREAELLRKIGELTVERDFLSNGLSRCR